MARVIHGGVTVAELREAEAQGIALIDLSASLNPYGPHERVVAAARTAVLERYPEPDAATLRNRYAEAAVVDPCQVLAGNGSTEVLYLLCQAFARQSSTALIVGPTFGEYRAAAEAAGMTVAEVRAEPPEFALPEVALSEAIQELRPGLVFLCNPNNPTGLLVPRSVLYRMHQCVVDAGGVLVVDEAYMDFAWPRDERMQPAPGLALVRSLTKLHAVPGLRLGFLAAEPGIIAAVERLQPCWSVSAPAAAAGLQALNERAFADESRELVAATRAHVQRALSVAGIPTGPSSANFVLLRAGDAPRVRKALLQRGWVVRDCSSFGLPTHIRVAIPRAGQADRLLGDLLECVS
ncbi:MAG: aminotransferase class I/II [Anaerolinea sp.]|nr:aminotransferase class I/II [Anaerolinea sp.]